MGGQPEAKETSIMAIRKTSKTTARKATAAKPRTVAKATPFEAKVGDRKLLDVAVEAAGAWRDAAKKRDAAIRAAVKGGTSARQVGLAVGLSHSAVLKITRR
jgi:hypothetical protein